MIKKNGLKSLIMVFLLTFLLAAVNFGGSQSLFSQAITEFSKKCVTCHQKASPCKKIGLTPFLFTFLLHTMWQISKFQNTVPGNWKVEKKHRPRKEEK